MSHWYDPLRHQAASRPAEEALRDEQTSWSFATLDREVDRLASCLMHAGLAPGSRVGLLMARTTLHLMTVWALLRLGAVAAPLSLREPVERLPDLLKIAGAAALLVDREHPAQLEHRVLLEEHGVRLIDVEDLAQTAIPRPEPLPGLKFSRPATVVFTSGSTGQPKAALHAYSAHVLSAVGANRNMVLTSGHRWLLSLPLYHVGGLAILFRTLVGGASAVIPAPGASLGRQIEQQGITHLSLVPTQLRRLLVEAADLSGVQAILLGGSAAPAALLDEAVTRGLPLHTTYGMTETASQVTTTPPASSRETLDTAGRRLPHRDLRIGAGGEIEVRGPTCFLGYLGPEGVHRPFDAHGWFRTGDLGTFDDQARLRVTGRRDNQFISGGENIQPEEIERALLQIEGVEEAVVVPVSDAEYGARPVAFVRGAAPLGTLAERLEGRLARFKRPDAFLPWPEEAEGGLKVSRARLRASAEAASRS